MSRRTQHFARLKQSDADDTRSVLLSHNSRVARSNGRMSRYEQGEHGVKRLPGRPSGLIGTLPMQPEKAARIAAILHQK